MKLLEHRLVKRIMEQWKRYIICAALLMYMYGMIINSIITASNNFQTHANAPVFSFNPIKCFAAVFTPHSLGAAFFIFIMYALISQRWNHLITGVKVTKDERNFYITNEGTHGTSGWMTEQQKKSILLIGGANNIQAPILGKLKNGDYFGLNPASGLNKHVMIYGASGVGKSRGYVKPFILKTARLRQSMIIVDPKGEFFEQMSGFLSKMDYTVKAYNLLDMENSEGWNCIGETEGRMNMVQSVAEVIIRNTSASASADRPEFWDKAEMNLLIALILYVESLKVPGTNRRLPIHERSLGTIYKLLSTEDIQSLNSKFAALPPDHPALGPYGIFKKAQHNLWGNIALGLGSRLNVFQNKLVDQITKYHEIDLELPGREPCAYFCIISDQDSSMEFLSSMFFSLLFKKLSDYARKFGERGRLPVEVNFLLDEFCNVGKILDFKKVLSTVRSRGINCQLIIQSVAQLADRYPVNEWQEIVGNCDTQLCLGCNDEMTSKSLSVRCGNITIQTTNSMSPQPPSFSPASQPSSAYKQTRANASRPLMYPEEILQMDNRECLLIFRDAKPLKAYKIIPDELADYALLENIRIADYIPEWRKFPENQDEAEEDSVNVEDPVKEENSKKNEDTREVIVASVDIKPAAPVKSVEPGSEYNIDEQQPEGCAKSPVNKLSVINKN